MVKKANILLCPALILLFSAAGCSDDIKECSAELVNMSNKKVFATYFMKDKKLRIEVNESLMLGKILKIVRLDEGMMYTALRDPHGDDRAGIRPLKGDSMPGFGELNDHYSPPPCKSE